jgi:hypothetical protein
MSSLDVYIQEFDTFEYRLFKVSSEYCKYHDGIAVIDECGWNSLVLSSIPQLKLTVRHEMERIYVVPLDIRCSLQGTIGNIPKREHHNLEFPHFMRNQ